MKHGFELIREQEIPELNTMAHIWRHIKTGAEYLSLENDDENKVFGITFRTPPPDSTGLPHILEHSVLSGSRKYPLKDPFIELAKGSLNTFINAFTDSDNTSYPVASQNVKDLYNLADVYLDAVFYPLITPNTLKQEGWHYELEDADDPLTFKGIVFNEMKGAYSSPDSLSYRQSRISLFPDTPYGRDSGGDPAAIPDLTYEQFKAFHETYYHPSNARLFWYGDDDPEERLRYLNEWLKEFDRIEVDSALPLQPRFDEPRSLAYPFDAGEETAGKTPKGQITVNWLLDEGIDPELIYGLEILEHILVGTPASPLRKALIDSGLGEDLTGAGLSSGSRQMTFSTGLKGIAVEDADRVQGLIETTLQHLVDEGVDPNTVAASMNTIEFQLREVNFGRFPRGLALVFVLAMNTWLHDHDPLALLAFEAPLQSIKDRLQRDERYFEGLIQKYLVANTHRTTVLLEPDPNVRQEQEATERDRLDRARETMGAEDVERIVEETHELARLQGEPDSPEALATIPSLAIEDLDKENKLIPIESFEGSEGTTLHHDLFTNGILYLDLAFDLHGLPQALLPYVPLFGQALIKMGTGTEDFVQLAQRIGQKTGGISPTNLVSAIPSSDEAVGRLVLRAKSTVDRADDLFAILQDILLTVQLDNPERFKQIVLEAKAQLESALVPAGHRMALYRLGAQFGQAGWLNEQLGGIEQLFFLRQLSERVEKDWAGVLADLEQVRQALVNHRTLVSNVTLDESNWQVVQPRLKEFVSALPGQETCATKWVPQTQLPFEGLTIPARVNYVAKGTTLYDKGYTLDGSIMVIANLLRTGYLWEKIRIQGGAYGGFCAFDRQSGQFAYASYRDPNLLGTIDNYGGTAQFLRDLDLSDDELLRNIIGAIGTIDDYQLPDAKGYTSLTRYLVGESDADRQLLRDQVLGTTQADFKAFADVLDQVTEHGHVVVLGSQEAIDQANQERGDWLQVTKVL